MSDGLTLISVILGFGLVVVIGAKIGAGSHTALAGLFGPPGGLDWPIGVQEADAPRFVFAPPSPRPVQASAAGEGLAGDGLAGDARPPEIEELYAGPIRS